MATGSTSTTGPHATLLAAVQTIARHRARFKGSVVDVVEEFGAGEAVDAAIRAALAPLYQPGPKRLAVAWIVPPPPVMTKAPPLVSTPRSERRPWQPHLKATDRDRRAYWKQIQTTFGRPWRVYVDRTSSHCYQWRQAHEAQTKGYDVWHAVCRNCPLSGWPHTPPLPRPKPKRWDRACTVIQQREGPHGYRVLPEYMVWRDAATARARPPATADIIVLSRWPTRDKRYWSTADVRDVTTRFKAYASAPLLDALIELAERPGLLQGPELYGLLADRIDIPDALTIWEASHALMADVPGAMKMRRAPHNLEALLRALGQDQQDWAAAGDTPFLSRLIVGNNRLRIRPVTVEVPEIFRNMAVIDLTGTASANSAPLIAAGLTLITADQLLTRAGPPRRDGEEETTKWERNKAEVLARLLAACQELDARGLADKKTKTAIMQQAGYALSQRAALSRSGKVSGDLMQMVAGAYGGEWQRQPGRGNRVFLVRTVCPGT